LQFVVVVVVLLPGTTNCSAQPTQKEDLGVSLCVSASLYYQFLQSKEEHREKSHGVRMDSVRRRGISSFPIVSSGRLTCPAIDKRWDMVVIGRPPYMPT
jgi:hypothetical protein